MYRCNAYAGSTTLAYNSNLMSPGDRYVTKSCLNLLQSLKCFDGTILIHSEMEEHHTAQSE